MTTPLDLHGSVSKETQEQKCLLRVLLFPDVGQMPQVGYRVPTPRCKTAKSPSGSVSTGHQTAVLGPSIFKCLIAVVTICTSSVEHLPQIPVTSVTVALTENGPNPFENRNSVVNV